MRQQISSGSPFEPEIGFSRAVRVGHILAVSGTAPIAPDGTVAAPGNMYQQTRRCFEIAREAIEEAGASLDDVIRTRIMLTNIDTWENAACAHRDIFGDIRPACTFVEVSRFIHPGWLVEIEVDCVLETQQCN